MKRTREDSKIGPNVLRLIAEKASLDAVPPGGGVQDALGFLSSKSRIISGVNEAKAWVRMAIQTVREAAEPNQWKNADDETIAAEILRRVEEKRRQKSPLKIPS